MKIIRIVVTGCQILKLKCTNFNFGWGSAQTLLGELPTPLAGFKGQLLRMEKMREWREGRSFLYFFLRIYPHGRLFCYSEARIVVSYYTEQFAHRLDEYFIRDNKLVIVLSQIVIVIARRGR